MWTYARAAKLPANQSTELLDLRSNRPPKFVQALRLRVKEKVTIEKASGEVVKGTGQLSSRVDIRKDVEQLLGSVVALVVSLGLETDPSLRDVRPV